MQVSLILLSTILSLSMASPTRERRQFCELDEDCANRTYCVVKKDSTEQRWPRHSLGSRLATVCRPIPARSLAARQDDEKPYESSEDCRFPGHCDSDDMFTLDLENPA